MGNPFNPHHSAAPGLQFEQVATRESMYAAHVEWLRAQRGAHVVIVCGGRNYADRERVFSALDLAHAKKPITLLVHGAAPGADLLADRWAEERGVWRQPFKAAWDSRGPAAGPERNQRMVAAGAHGCIAFPGGRGTADCVRRCEAAGIPVWRPFG